MSRIRWDPRFRRGRFEIGYFDRVEGGIVAVPLEAIHLPRDRRSVFELHDEEGVLRRIPLHRVRRVWRDGRIIWERRVPTTGTV